MSNRNIHAEPGTSLFGMLGTLVKEDLSPLVERVGTLCILSYNIDQNPLPALRKRYGALEWRRISCLCGFGDFLDQISGCDFVWSIRFHDFVVATWKKKATESKKIFWSDASTDYDEGRTFQDRIDGLQARGFEIYGILDSERYSKEN